MPRKWMAHTPHLAHEPALRLILAPHTRRLRRRTRPTVAVRRSHVTQPPRWTDGLADWVRGGGWPEAAAAGRRPSDPAAGEGGSTACSCHHRQWGAAARSRSLRARRPWGAATTRTPTPPRIISRSARSWWAFVADCHPYRPSPSSYWWSALADGLRRRGCGS